MLESFEDLVGGCLETGKPFHLLYVYMKLSDAPGNGADREALFPGQDLAGIDALGTIAFDAYEPVKPGLTFERMRENADNYHPGWDVVFIMTARNADGSPITDGQAREHLADMRERIMSGDFPDWAPIFDRTGALKSIERSRPVDLSGQGRRAN
jgi:hypothetical protein